MKTPTRVDPNYSNRQRETKEFRLPPGQIVLYPSSTLHCVTPVVSGVRYVCVGWIESYVKALMTVQCYSI